MRAVAKLTWRSALSSHFECLLVSIETTCRYSKMNNCGLSTRFHFRWPAECRGHTQHSCSFNTPECFPISHMHTHTHTPDSNHSCQHNHTYQTTPKRANECNLGNNLSLSPFLSSFSLCVCVWPIAWQPVSPFHVWPWCNQSQLNNNQHSLLFFQDRWGLKGQSKVRQISKASIIRASLHSLRLLMHDAVYCVSTRVQKHKVATVCWMWSAKDRQTLLSWQQRERLKCAITKHYVIKKSLSTGIFTSLTDIRNLNELRWSTLNNFDLSFN